MDYKNLLAEIKRTALKAGALELEHYNAGTSVMEKKDGSPVTIADQEAEVMILKDLVALTPDIPIVAEEEAAAGNIPDISGGLFWLVDPLDGTKEFVRRSGDFTVNIALMRDFEPVLGVIYTPVADELYGGYGNEYADLTIGKETRQIQVRNVPDEGLTVVASHSHSAMEDLERYLTGQKIAGTTFRGSSLKFCQVACGEADIYPRLAPTCEWDIAAGHAIVAGAGGQLHCLDGSPMRYGKSEDGFLNPFFVVKA
jgi:3'(2'), 5'-bisphosphate nucleotidase